MPYFLLCVQQNSSGSVVIKVEPKFQENAGGTEFYLKSHFDYNPKTDRLIPSQVCVRACVHACVHAYDACACTCVCVMCVHVHASAYEWVHVYMCVCACVCMHVFV